MSERLIAYIKKVIRKWPAYRNFLRQCGINPSRIETIHDLPITDKQFLDRAIHTIPLHKVRSIVPSSGSTGMFSFGFYGDAEIKRALGEIDEFLEQRFASRKRKTLLLNLLPGPISPQSATASIASIGVRMDTAIDAVKLFGAFFDQLILVGEPLFVKNLMECGNERSVTWRYVPMHVIVGGDWISESYRNYIEEIIGFNRLSSSMGMAELGLNYFHETDETIMFRRLMYENIEMRQTILGEVDFCPMLFAYNENAIYVETVALNDCKHESILLTTLDISRSLPLIRYMSGDKGRLLERERINQVLKTFGYSPVFESSGPPILAHYGRGDNVFGIYPERIKEIIYSSDQVASSTTGNFMLSERNGEVELNIQLRGNVGVNRQLEELYSQAFKNVLSHINLHLFEEFPNPLDFERKIQYVNTSAYRQKRNREEAELSVAV